MRVAQYMFPVGIKYTVPTGNIKLPETLSSLCDILCTHNELLK